MDAIVNQDAVRDQTGRDRNHIDTISIIPHRKDPFRINACASISIPRIAGFQGHSLTQGNAGEHEKDAERNTNREHTAFQDVLFFMVHSAWSKKCPGINDRPEFARS
ncbi:MAG: hypothetical protein MZV70_59655 [Desulfobacterales bacterium]|nr:hypothetical protein [Desulfobacterales bacterium]